MSRCYADRVEVLRRNEEPAHFLWRSRLYVVRGVLGHWVETGEWWRTAGADAPSEHPLATVPDRAGTALGGTQNGHGPGGIQADGRARENGRLATAARPSRRTDADVAVATDDSTEEGSASTAGDVVEPPLDEEHEIWRVEASSGRSGVPGIYDLCFAWSSGAWTLVRTAD
jgi:hypothetical protein